MEATMCLVRKHLATSYLMGFSLTKSRLMSEEK